MRVRALQDVYAVLGTCSKRVQDTQALPWERQASQAEATTVLSDMRAVLPAMFKRSQSPKDLQLVSDKEQLWPRLLSNQAQPEAAEVSNVMLKQP